MEARSYQWSLWQAAKVFLKTIYGDLYGDRACRRKLVQKLPIAQEAMPVGDRILSYLIARGAPGAEPRIPVLFLHGTPGSALCWKGLLSDPGNMTIIALDRPGFGASKESAPDLEKDIGPLGGLLERIAAQYGQAIVAGHSLGAGLAARLAADHPASVRGLLLIGGSVDPRLERTFAAQRAFAAAPFSRLLTRTLRSSNRELLQYTSFLEKLGPDLARVTCPVGAVHSRDDRLVSFENTAYAKSHFKNAPAFKLTSLESGGHFINHSRIGAIKQALNDLAGGTNPGP